MGYNLGVDLGTTFVAAAIARDGRPEMCTLGSQTVVSPAVVYFTEESRLAFGDAAERRALSRPDRVERAFKRRLGDPTPVVLGGVPHAVTALMAAQLRDVLDTVSRVEGEPPERVALTCPATWGPYRRELFEEVPRLAGLHDHVTLTEPEAAAAFYGASRLLDEGDTLAVYDLGGGTFDATVLRKRGGAVEVVGDPDGMERLGGIDFDEAILQWIDYRNGGALSDLDLSQPAAAAAMARLRQECVHAKEALSADIETSIPVLLPHRQFFTRLTRDEFEGLIRAPVESTIGTLIRAVHTARLEVGQLSGMLLVGGSSRIPLIERMVAAETGRPTVTDAHPKYAVALGAALVAGLRPAPVMPPPPAAVPSAPVAAVVGEPIAPPPRRRRRIAAVLAIVVAVVLLAGTAVHLAGRSNGRPTNAGAHLPGASAAAPAVSAAVAVDPAASAAVAVDPVASAAVAPAVAVPSIDRPVTLAHAPDYVAAAPDGRRLYIASGEQTVSVLDVATGTVTGEIPTPGPARFVSFSPDGRYAYVSLWDHRGGQVHAVSVVDTDDNTITKTFPVRTRPYLAAVTPDGNWLYVPNHDGHTVTVIDARQLVEVAEITVPPEPHYVSFSVDGTRAYVADHESNTISVVDTATRRVLTDIDVGRSPHAVEQNPHRPLLMNVNWDDGTVCVIDTTANTVRRTITVGARPLGLRWSADGRYAYVVNSGSNNVSVIRADTLQVTATLPTGEAPTSIAVLPDGSRGYVSNSKAKTLTVLNLTR